MLNDNSRFFFILSILFNILGTVKESDIWSAIFFICSILSGVAFVIATFKGHTDAS